jgi:ABC-type antimicrobial peptide transport system permease subunit
VLLVVIVGVGDAVAASTIERTRELGIIRALGARRGVVLRMVMAETALQAALGIIVAVAFGIGLGVLWVKVTFPALVGWTLSLHVPPGQASLVVVGAVTCSLVGAYLPARRASRLDPVAALHAE